MLAGGRWHQKEDRGFVNQSLHLSLENTYIRTNGAGENILVFHGGPGFDHSYLVRHLSFLASHHNLIFFDQYGAGKSAVPTEELTFDLICAHAAQVISRFQTNNEIRVIAHSFGVAVLLGALSSLPEIKPSGLLLNAVPTNKDRFDAMRAALFTRMGPEVTMSLADTNLTVLAPAQLAVLLQFYTSPQSKPDLSDLSFNFSQYNHVYKSLDHFDVSDGIKRLSECDLILGGDDFIDTKLIEDVRSACRSTTSLPNAGHFTFAEQPDLFRAAAIRSLTKV